jgi:hypothetical protein
MTLSANLSGVSIRKCSILTVCKNAERSCAAAPQTGLRIATTTVVPDHLASTPASGDHGAYPTGFVSDAYLAT